MVNSSNPSTDRVTLRLHYSLHEASWKPQLPLEYPAIGNFFWRPPFRPTSTPTGVSLPDLSSYGNLAGKYFSKRRHVSISSPALKFTRRCMGHCLATRLLQQGHLPPASLPNHSTHPTVAGKSPSFPLFLSDDCFYVAPSPQSPLFLCFLKLYDTFRTLEVDSVDLLLISHLYD